MSDPLAVIFDVDGVLIDSYQAHFQSWKMLADQRGFHRLTESEFLETFGRTSREIIVDLSEDDLTSQQVAELDARKEILFREILEADFQAMQGAGRLIDTLADAGFLLAAGSSGPPENVHLVLNRLARRHRFNAVVTGMDVTRGKPDPEVFLHCAERLGVPPARAAVIEDAEVGIDAANRAGMTSIALVVPPRPADTLQHADHRVTCLDELSAGLIETWIG